MSEFSISNNFFRFCFFLLSHPLYFSYFVFFFPYLLKLLSFLSPLFVTTFLLLSAFLTLAAFSSSDRQSPDSKMGLLATTYQIVFDGLRPRTPDEVDEFRFRPLEEELEAYNIVFETYTFGIGTEAEENPYGGGHADVPEVEVKVDCEEPVVNFPETIKILPENPVPYEKTEEKEIIEDLRKELREDSGENEEMIGKQPTDQDSSISSRSESSPWSSPGSFGREYSSLGSYGSMRKEKEWRRTLACKLFEERHNAEGSEGMDSLWETYEKSESKQSQKTENQKQKQKLSKAKRGKKFQEEEDEDGDEGQLCCLQALKFSAGKMNLGMGRPNLVKMSKAFKGFGWLNRHGSRKALIH